MSDKIQELQKAFYDTIPLTQIGQEMRREYGVAAPYGKVYRAIVGGHVPAERGAGGWTVQRDDLPILARHLGLVA